MEDERSEEAPQKTMEQMAEKVDRTIKEKMEKQEERLGRMYIKAKEKSGQMIEEISENFNIRHIEHMNEINAQNQKETVRVMKEMLTKELEEVGKPMTKNVETDKREDGR